SAGLPTSGLLVSDAEVEEPLPPRTVPIFDGSTNMWYASLAGAMTAPGTTLGTPGVRYSEEPAGLTYDPVRKVLLVADDNTKQIHTVAAGGDGKLGTGDDVVVSSFYINVPHITRSNTDPESVTVDTSVSPNVIYVADALNDEMYRFSLSGTLLAYWDIGALGPMHPEGLVYDPSRNTLLVLDDGPPCRVYELSKDMALLNIVDMTKGKCTRAAGITLAPHSTNSKLRSMYVVDRGKDNTLANPDENDGLVEELYVNLPPLVTATGPATVTHPAAAALAGTARDDGNTTAMTYTWSEITGPGTVTFTAPKALTTNATFSIPGTYVLQLEAFDGVNRSTANVTVVSNGPPNAAVSVSPPNGNSPLPVTADASGSTDTDGVGIASYTFDFGDGSAKVTQAGPVAKHTYASGGNHTVTVTVTDTAGLFGSAKAAVAVNQKPTVSAGPDRSVVMPAAASLAGSATDDGRPNPPGTLTASWSKVSGPGTVTFAAAGAPSTTATFSAAGTYVLRLTATDSATTASDDVTVTVAAAVPAPPALPPPAQVPPVTAPTAPTVTVHAVTPQRILDTRSGLGAKQRKLRPGRALTLQVEGRGGFPSAGVDAVMLNITVLRPKARGSLTVWPSKLLRPSTKALVFKRGVTKSKLVKTVVGSDGKIRIYNRSARPIHLLASTNAWWGT
ncbi:MAG TPA: PKD domain-containing protein, partial [Actinomycetes bacterium]|nr:PKD domain-containing protein [Actinomycetes bacterium]